MEITHDSAAHRFQAATGGGEAYIEYNEPEKGVLDMTHTYVAPAERNKGVGEALAAYALDYVRTHDYLVIPSCPFIRKWITEHPQYQDRVTNHGFGTQAKP